MAIDNAAPANNATDARRDWSLTADITATGGVDSVALTIDGTSVTDTETSITNGKRITYSPGSSSSYGARVIAIATATLTEAITWAASTAYDTAAVRIGDDLHYECTTAGTSDSTEPTWPTTIDETVTDGTAVWTCKDDDYVYEWRFSIEVGASTATSSPPPEVVVVRDISLTSDESDDTHAGINVVWLPEITHPLIVDESQAEAVGTVEVDNNTYHKHRRTLRVDREDDNDDVVSSLQEGDLITFTATALGETAKKAEVLAIRQTVSRDNDIQYDLVVQYYEAV